MAGMAAAATEAGPAADDTVGRAASPVLEAETLAVGETWADLAALAAARVAMAAAMGVAHWAVVVARTSMRSEAPHWLQQQRKSRSR